MKTFSTTLLIVLFLLINTNRMQAQTTQTKLNQIELMKQFIGTWKSEFGEGTIFTCENRPFGNGMICNSQIVIKGKIIDSVTQLFGYDNKTDKFIIAELKESSPVIELCSTWFSSKNTGEIVVTNPDNAPYTFKFEFKTSDLIIQTAITDGKVVNEITLTRIESDIKK
jgi:hypothetical protein